MKNMIMYLGQVVIISGLLYGYYHFFLRNKKFHHYNRYYLLSATLLSFLIPFWNIPVYFAETDVHSSFVLETLAQLTPANDETAPIVWNEPLLSGTRSFDWILIPKIIFLGIVFLLLLRLVISLVKIRRIIRNYPSEKIDTIRFVNTLEPGTPYSFFRWLFWNRNIDPGSDKGKQIFRHELFHINQKHSVDILFMEILFLLFFLNPFFWLVKKELRAIHEFLADRYAASENNKWEYAELLLMQTLNTRQSLVNPFFHNQIKRRIAMITNPQKPGQQYLRKVMVLPLAFLAILLFAFNYKYRTKSPKTELSSPIHVVDDPGQGSSFQFETKSPKTALNKPFKVVIDAGHGGADIGAIGIDGTAEKNIVLAIARKIKELNENKNLEILLTRDGDVLPPLKSRTDFSNEQNADLFISLHVNTATDKSKTSFEILTPSGAKSERPENKMFAAVLKAYLKNAYSGEIISGPVKSSIWVLQNTDCPAVLIGCGYMSNEKELEFIKEEDNQEKIAKSILEAIVQFGNQNISKKEEIALSPEDTTRKKLVLTQFGAGKYGGSYDGNKIKEFFTQSDGSILLMLENKDMLSLSKDLSNTINSKKGFDMTLLVKNDQVKKIESSKLKWDEDSRSKPLDGENKISPSIQPATQKEFTIYNSTEVVIYNRTGVIVGEGRTIRQSLDPRTLYIGLDNVLSIESKELNTGSISATISNGSIEKKEDRFLVHVYAVIEDVSVKLYLDNNGKKEFIKEAIFKSRPLSEIKKVNPTNPRVMDASSNSSSIPKISVSELQRSTVHGLLQLPEDTEIIGYTFTIDRDDDIVKVPNTGSQFNQATRALMKEAQGGRLITIDLIRTRKEGVEKRIPSRIWYVTD